MESIREIYRIGVGPSSSHTMGPKKAAEAFKKDYPDSSTYMVTLFGSLAATGKGHLTDLAVIDALAPASVEIIWKPEVVLPFHPNAMELEALDSVGNKIASRTVYSVGGGAIIYDGNSRESSSGDIYTLNSMDDILKWCYKEGRSLWEYVYLKEDEGLDDFLGGVWEVMSDSIKAGLDNEGVLPGGLCLARKATSYHDRAVDSQGFNRPVSLSFAYALAVAEENAAGGTIVTAPTCGSCGVLPAVLMVMKDNRNLPEKRIKRALATAGLIGALVKHNASISGAEVGCQGEIGTACAMAAGAAAQLLGGSPQQIEYAAEMGLEHHLGLTCDPVAGLVQIPCIERNALAASRALDCAGYALLSDGRHRISFDEVVKTMAETGRDLMSSYRETSQGGLARLYRFGS